MIRSFAARACAPAALLAFVAGAPAMAAGQGAQIVDIKAPDGIVIKGSFHAGVKPGPGLLLMHACNRDRSSWDGLARGGIAQGFTCSRSTFAASARAAGRASRTSSSSRATVEPALAWRRRRRVCVAVGADGRRQDAHRRRRRELRRQPVRPARPTSSGSPNRRAAERRVTEAGRTFLRDSPWLPVFAAASHGDGGAVETMKWTLAWSRSPANSFLEYKAAGHGTDMFAVEKGLEPAVLAWLDAAPARRAVDQAGAAAPSKPTAVEEFWTTINEPGGVARARKMYDDADAGTGKSSCFQKAKPTCSAISCCRAEIPRMR